jgi:hypothetical protein
MTTCGVVDVVLWVVVVVRDGVIVVGGAEVEVEVLEAGAVTVVVTAVAPPRLLLAYAQAKNPMAASSTMMGIHQRPIPPPFFSGSGCRGG